MCLPGKEGNRIIEHDDSREGERTLQNSLQRVVFLSISSLSLFFSLFLRRFSLRLNPDRIFLTSGSCRDKTMCLPLCTRASDNVHRCRERAFPRRTHHGREETRFSPDHTAEFSYSLRTSHWQFTFPRSTHFTSRKPPTRNVGFFSFIPSSHRTFFYSGNMETARDAATPTSVCWIPRNKSDMTIAATAAAAARRKSPGKPNGGSTPEPIYRFAASRFRCIRDLDATARERKGRLRKWKREGERGRDEKESEGTVNAIALRRNPLAGLEW